MFGWLGSRTGKGLGSHPLAGQQARLPQFWATGGRHKVPGSEAEDFVIHGQSRARGPGCGHWFPAPSAHGVTTEGQVTAAHAAGPIRERASDLGGTPRV